MGGDEQGEDKCGFLQWIFHVNSRFEKKPLAGGIIPNIGTSGMIFSQFCDRDLAGQIQNTLGLVHKQPLHLVLRFGSIV
jgi:hypothetical protein